jgi:hypothetical protein
MALELTAKARFLSQKVNIEPQIIVEIDGIDLIFGALKVTKLAKYGQDNIKYGDPGLVYGGTIETEKGRDYIQLSGTTTQINQQILQDRGGSNSISSVKVQMIDKNGEMLRLLSPGQEVPDVLGRSAKFYLNFKGGAHPEDSVIVFDGLVDDIEFGAGFVRIDIAHPEWFKRQSVFPKATAVLDSDINNTDLIIPTDGADDFLLPADSGTFETYIRIGDEIIQYTSKTATNISATVRGALGTVAQNHDSGADIESFYVLSGFPYQLALKLMLSQADDPFATRDVDNFNFINALDKVTNAIFFAGEDVQRDLGITEGDLVSTTGASNPANNITELPIGAIVNTAFGSYVVVPSASFVDEVDSGAVASFKSKYDVLPDGLGMTPNQVDIQRHEELQQVFTAQFSELKFYLRDTLTNLKEFINTEIYFYGAGSFSLPRKGRASVGITLPPLALFDSKILNEESVKSPSKLTLQRGINRNFYNAIIYAYEEDVLDEGRFLKGEVTQSARSTNRIKVRNIPLQVKSKGLRDNNRTDLFIQFNTRRILDRYQFGAEKIVAEVTYRTGFNIEPGDTAILEFDDLKVADTKNVTRDFKTRVFEVTNKSMNIKTGQVRLELLDTAFGVDGRFGTIGPSSQINSGATTTEIPLKRSYGTLLTPGQLEQQKWNDYVGQVVEVHSPDWTFTEKTTFIGFDNINLDTMIVDPPLSVAPQEDYIVDTPTYPANTNVEDQEFWKALHCSFTPRVDITSGIDNFTFEVAAVDVSKFFVGAIVEVHSSNFSDESDQVEVTDITGQNITVSEDLGFTPSSGYEVDLIGFPDQGLPYRLF